MNLETSHSFDFSQVAGVYWKKEGAFKMLHSMNDLRVDFVSEFIQADGKQVLDFGCGGGLFTEAMASKGAIVKGVDSSKEMIAIAKQHDQEHGIDYVCSDRISGKKKFDFITIFEVVEHMEDEQIKSLLEQASNHLKTNGLLFISTINRTMLSFIKSIMLAEIITRMIPRGTHQYEKFVKPSELVHCAENQGLQVVAIRGMDFSPLNDTWVYSKPHNCYSVCFKKNEIKV